ncbi:hypothetical protein EYF80_063126 [Liparis tanakae]|uniref:Uncharacterized protein n=1 Tax=Liparis tanakae TaxID=230148 RepID=A0A4Z2ED06_9TELE|nr:hypothetical protein EYF80_063126 [Liparis tanakae]
MFGQQAAPPQGVSHPWWTRTFIVELHQTPLGLLLFTLLTETRRIKTQGFILPRRPPEARHTCLCYGLTWIRQHDV